MLGTTLWPAHSVGADGAQACTRCHRSSPEAGTKDQSESYQYSWDKSHVLTLIFLRVYGLVKDYLLSVKVCDNSADDLMPIWSLLTTKRSPSKFDIRTRPHTNPRRNLSWDGLGQDFRLGCTGIDSIREMLGFR